eukprot:gene10525-7311_t
MASFSPLTSMAELKDGNPQRNRPSGIVVDKSCRVYITQIPTTRIEKDGGNAMRAEFEAFGPIESYRMFTEKSGRFIGSQMNNKEVEDGAVLQVSISKDHGVILLHQDRFGHTRTQRSRFRDGGADIDGDRWSHDKFEQLADGRAMEEVLGLRTRHSRGRGGRGRGQSRAERIDAAFEKYIQERDTANAKATEQGEVVEVKQEQQQQDQKRRPRKRCRRIPPGGIHHFLLDNQNEPHDKTRQDMYTIYICLLCLNCYPLHFVCMCASYLALTNRSFSPPPFSSPCYRLPIRVTSLSENGNIVPEMRRGAVRLSTARGGRQNLPRLASSLLRQFAASQHSPAWGGAAELQRFCDTDACAAARQVLFDPRPCAIGAASWRGPDPRQLSNRFNNCWESNKDFGFTEVAADDVRKDDARLAGVSRLLVLVAHSHTRHAVGNGEGLQDVARRTERIVMAPANRDVFHDIFRVVRVCLGIRASGSSALSYPDCGLYSLQCVVSEWAALPPTAGLAPHVLIISDAWLQARSCATACCSAQCRVDVLPALVTNTATTKEVAAFSRYAAASVRCRQTGSRRPTQIHENKHKYCDVNGSSSLVYLSLLQLRLSYPTSHRNTSFTAHLPDTFDYIIACTPRRMLELICTPNGDFEILMGRRAATVRKRTNIWESLQAQRRAKTQRCDAGRRGSGETVLPPLDQSATRSNSDSADMGPVVTHRRPTLQFSAPGETPGITVVEELPASFMGTLKGRPGTGKGEEGPGIAPGSFDGLELGILSDLNATLSGTRHSTFERTRSLDGTGGTGRGALSPPGLEGTFTTTISSTNRDTANFNDTLGRSERAELLAEELKNSADPDEDEEAHAFNWNRGNMADLKAAVRQAEALSEAYDRLEEAHPLSRSRVELPAPRTQAAIARLYPLEPPPPLDLSVGVEGLSVRGIRRRFGPARTLITDFDAKLDNSEQFSVCSAAQSLFRERAPSPSECGTRMAISVAGEPRRPSSAASSSGATVTAASRAESPIWRAEQRVLPPLRRATRAPAPPTSPRFGPQKDFFCGPRFLKRVDRLLLQRAMREREKELHAYLQSQPEKSKLLTMVRQWCDRTRLEKGDGADTVQEDPAAAHKIAMEVVLKEEEAARSRLHFTRLQAREKLRIQSIEARDSAETRFRLPRTVDILGPHKRLCQQLNPFDLEGPSENEFISVVKPIDEDDMDVFASGTFSSSASSRLLSPSMRDASPVLRGGPSGSFLPTGSETAALTAEENGLLELLLLSLLDNSNWGNPDQPFVPKLPTMVFSPDDIPGAGRQLSRLYLKSAVRCTDLINLLDIHVGLSHCVGRYGVEAPPARAGLTNSGCRLLPLTFPSDPELGLPDMPRCSIDVLPLTLCYTVRSSAGVDAQDEVVQVCCAIDMLDLFRRLPTVANETLVRFRGGGSSQNPHYRVNVPQWCKNVFKRTMLEVHRAAAEAYRGTTSLVFDPFSSGDRSVVTECSLIAFEVDWQHCIHLSRWRSDSLKSLADSFWAPSRPPSASAPPSTSSSATLSRTTSDCDAKGSHNPAPYNLYITASLALDQSNLLLFPRTEQLRQQYHNLLGALRTEGRGVRPRPRQGDGPRRSTESLSRRSSQTLFESPSFVATESDPVEKPRLGLATALKQWSGVQKILDAETAYSTCLNSIHNNEVSIRNFNSHVDRYNEYRAKESLVWGPLYRSGLRLAHALCLYLEVRPFDAMPEKLVAFLHPMAQFCGCAGGYREMKANLKEVKISIAERCRRVAVAVEIMTIEDAEQLLASAMAALDHCHNASAIVSVQATEGDVLTTSLTPHRHNSQANAKVELRRGAACGVRDVLIHFRLPVEALDDTPLSNTLRSTLLLRRAPTRLFSATGLAPPPHSHTHGHTDTQTLRNRSPFSFMAGKGLSESNCRRILSLCRAAAPLPRHSRRGSSVPAMTPGGGHGTLAPKRIDASGGAQRFTPGARLPVGYLRSEAWTKYFTSLYQAANEPTAPLLQCPLCFTSAGSSVPWRTPLGLTTHLSYVHMHEGWSPASVTPHNRHVLRALAARTNQEQDGWNRWSATGTVLSSPAPALRLLVWIDVANVELSFSAVLLEMLHSSAFRPILSHVPIGWCCTQELFVPHTCATVHGVLQLALQHQHSDVFPFHAVTRAESGDLTTAALIGAVRRVAGRDAPPMVLVTLDAAQRQEPWSSLAATGPLAGSWSRSPSPATPSITLSSRRWGTDSAITPYAGAPQRVVLGLDPTPVCISAI